MKTYNEIEEKQEEYNQKYDSLDKNDEKTREDRIIFGHWIDFLDDLLDWNILDYAEKIGFDFEKHDDMFEITEEVKKRNYNKRRASRRRIKNKRKNLSKIPLWKLQK